MLHLVIRADEPVPAALPLDGVEVQVWRDLDGTVCACGQTLGGRHWLHFPGLASYHFEAIGTDTTVIAIPVPPVRPELIWDTFYRSVLPLALQARGREALHASAVLAPAGVVGFCAVSQTGKSTLACGLSRRGYPLWSDDALAFEPAGDAVMALPLPFSLSLRPASAAHFGLAGSEQPDGPTQSGFTAHAHPRPLLALGVLARLPDEPGCPLVEVVRLPSVRAFSAVLPHAYCFALDEPQQTRTMLRHYLHLAAAVPVFDVRFRPGLDHFERVLDEIERVVCRAEREPAGLRERSA